MTDRERLKQETGLTDEVIDQLTSTRDYPFITDGCSGFMSFLWNVFTKKAPPWEGFCVAHDFAYWQGGDNSLRLEADAELMRKVSKEHPYWAVLIFIGVRLGGMWWLPFPSIRKVDGKWIWAWNTVRWGYGYKYPRYK